METRPFDRTRHLCALLAVAASAFPIFIPIARAAPGTHRERYSIRPGDTVSDVLFRKGIRFPRYRIYGEKGYLLRTERLNPSVRNWDRVAPGSVIVLELPDRIDEGPFETTGGYPSRKPPAMASRPEPVKAIPFPRPGPSLRPIPTVLPASAPATSGRAASTRFFGLLGLGIHSSQEVISGQVSETANVWSRPLIGARGTHVGAGSGTSPWVGEITALFGFDQPFEGVSFPLKYRVSAVYLPPAAREAGIRFGGAVEDRNLTQLTPDLSGSSPATGPKRVRTLHVLSAEVLARLRFRLFGLPSTGDLRFGPAITDTPSADGETAPFSGGLLGLHFGGGIRSGGLSLGGLDLGLEANFESDHLWRSSGRWTESAGSLLVVVPF